MKVLIKETTNKPIKISLPNSLIFNGLTAHYINKDKMLNEKDLRLFLKTLRSFIKTHKGFVFVEIQSGDTYIEVTF